MSHTQTLSLSSLDHTKRNTDSSDECNLNKWFAQPSPTIELSCQEEPSVDPTLEEVLTLLQRFKPVASEEETQAVLNEVKSWPAPRQKVKIPRSPAMAVETSSRLAKEVILLRSSLGKE